MATHLPPQPTPFIGRAEELAEIARRLDDPACRLLTLVGPGGCGKTRLALEAAARQADRFPDGVYFVPLQALGAPDDMVTMTAGILGVQFYEGVDPRQQLLDFLRERHLLLLLDNFEHLLDGAELLVEILDAGPGVKLLVTSRAALNLRQEWAWPVAGMHYPGKDDEADCLETCDAMQLFAERAQRVQANFVVHDELPHVARLCRLVEGMPLAIELAASWLRALTCADIATEIGRGIDILATAQRDVPERHRSMQAVFEHSWRLLTAEERDVFVRLSVFRGGCTREAAEAVAGATLPALAALVDKSFLRREPSGRYSVHELMRQYGAAKLAVSGETDAAHTAHCAYFSDLLHQHTSAIKGRGQRHAYDVIAADYENVRAAWFWAVDHEDIQALERAWEGLYWLTWDRFPGEENCRLFGYARARFQSQPGAEPHPIMSRLLGPWYDNVTHSAEIDAATIMVDRAAFQAEVTSSLTAAQKRDDRVGAAHCLTLLGTVVLHTGDCARAMTYFEQGLEHYRALGDDFYSAIALYKIGYTLSQLGHLKRGRQHALQVLELARQTGNPMVEFWCLNGQLIPLDLRRGNYVEVEDHLRQSQILAEEVRSLAFQLHGTPILSLTRFLRGDFAGARAAMAGGLEFPPDSWPAMYMLSISSLLASMEEDYEEGRRLCEEISSLQVIMLLDSSWAELLGVTSWALAVAACGLEDYQAAWRHLLAALRVASSPVLGLASGPAPMTWSLPAAAAVLAHEGDPVRAVELLGLAFTHPASATGWMEKWPLLTRLRDDLEAELGPDAYAAAWEHGAALDLEAVVAGFLDSAQPDAPSPQQAANAALAEPLSARELEVLALLAERRSNREIASRLVVALGTVKTHVHNICQKLGVTDRLQAVARARDLKLL